MTNYFTYCYNTDWGLRCKDKKGVRIVDVNGDGLADIIQGYTFEDEDGDDNSRSRAWINNGPGWTYDDNWEPPVSFTYCEYDSDYCDNKGVRMADVNGDGLVDILQGYKVIYHAWINNGSGWTQDDNWKPPTRFRSSSDKGVRITDVNGDGLVDIIRGYRYWDKTNKKYKDANNAWINNGYGWRKDNANWKPEDDSGEKY